MLPELSATLQTVQVTMPIPQAAHTTGECSPGIVSLNVLLQVEVLVQCRW